MDSDKLYLTISFLPQTEESLDMTLGVGEKMKQKMKHFMNFPIVVHPYIIKKKNKNLWRCSNIWQYSSIYKSDSCDLLKMKMKQIFCKKLIISRSFLYLIVKTIIYRYFFSMIKFEWNILFLQANIFLLQNHCFFTCQTQTPTAIDVNFLIGKIGI